MPRGRTDSASRIIRAAPEAVYRAFASAEAWTVWLPPAGMTATIEEFDFRPGGHYRLALTYRRPGPGEGKTLPGTDVVEGRFVELVDNRKMVQEAEFVADDPAFAGVMTMTWSLAPVPEGTEVTIVAENVPPGIRAEDHDEGLRSTLSNLAAFAETPAGRPNA